MYDPLKSHVEKVLSEIRAAGLWKEERVLGSAQGARVTIVGGREVLNFCSNNYLGLANDPRVVAAAKKSYDRWGYGLSSVRFICGTQALHKELEQKLSEFLGTEDTILYSSCFDANGGLFETLLGPEDAVVSDELNHASIIDGIRLSKAMRFRYKNRDMRDLREQLMECEGARLRLIATDGVFSMDGTLAPLRDICNLADEFKAAVMVDDSHATGILGKRGRGSHEHHGVMDRIDVITGTLGKALGGASGGFASGRKEIIELLRQRSRPYLFSNTLAPAIAATSLAVLELVAGSTELRDRLESNTNFFRDGMRKRGFDVAPEGHPIVVLMLHDAALATKMAKLMLDEGVYVVGFSYPVVPKDKARIRVQVSAAHTEDDLNAAMDAFARVKKACK